MKKIPFAFLLIFALSLTSFLLYKRYHKTPLESATEANLAPIKSELQQRYLTLFPKLKLPLHLREDLLLDKAFRQPQLESEMSPFIEDLSEIDDFSRTPPQDFHPIAHLASWGDVDVLLYAVSHARKLDRQKFRLQTLSRKTGKIIGEREVTYIDEGFHIQAEVLEGGRELRVFDAVSERDIRLLRVSEEGKISVLQL